MPNQAVLEQVGSDLESIAIQIRNQITGYRIVAEPREFYALAPGAEALEPTQKTPVPWLYLAGDYTRQRYLATIEGALYSGKLAAHAVIKSHRDNRP